MTKTLQLTTQQRMLILELLADHKTALLDTIGSADEEKWHKKRLAKVDELVSVILR